MESTITPSLHTWFIPSRPTWIINRHHLHAQFSIIFSLPNQLENSKPYLDSCFSDMSSGWSGTLPTDWNRSHLGKRERDRLVGCCLSGNKICGFIGMSGGRRPRFSWHTQIQFRERTCNSPHKILELKSGTARYRMTYGNVWNIP